MKEQMILLALVANLVVSCSTKRNQFSSNEISGTYAREYIFEVDTISIISIDEGYEVSNNKWKLNDYDDEGWQNMEHAEDRPFLNYLADYIQKDSALISRLNPSLIFYIGNSFLYTDKDRLVKYYRI